MIGAALLPPNNKEQSMADDTVRGRFVWHELVTPNGKGAQEFYARALGWKVEGWEHDQSYPMFVGPTGPLGAAVESRDAVPLWVPYVGTTDVDATVETAKRLGAKVATEPADLPNAGRFAVLVDPNGATFGVHASGGAPSPDKEPEPGEFSWHELATTVDPVAAFGFYRELFGWDDVARHDMGPMGMYLLFGRNGRQLGGIFNKSTMGKPGSAYWLGYVRTKNLDKLAADVKAARGSVLMEPDAVPGGHRIAQFEDPHGAFFAGHTLAQDVTAAPAKKAAAAPAAKSAQPAKAAAPAKATAPPKAATPAKAAAAKPMPAPKAAPKKEPGKKKAAPKKSAKKKAPKKKTAKKVAKKAAKKPAKKRTARKAAKKPAKKSAKKAKRIAAAKKSAKPKKKAPKKKGKAKRR
jgi:predicted enzyme related to lactoylglutathione lyase